MEKDPAAVDSTTTATTPGAPLPVPCPSSPLRKPSKPKAKPKAKAKTKPKAVLSSKSAPTLECTCWTCQEKRQKRDRKNHPVTSVLSLDMGTRSLGLCHISFTPDLIRGLKAADRAEVRGIDWLIERWGIVDFGINQARGATDELVCLFTGCGQYYWAGNLDAGVDVVMESQPVNGPSKVLAHCFQTFFALTDQHQGKHGREVYFMAPNNKLKVDPDLLAHYDQEHSAKNYDVRKAVVMHIARWILARNELNAHWRTYYSRQPYKQRTDLADALAQGIRYLMVENSLGPEHIQAELDALPPDSPGAGWLLAQTQIDQQDWQKKAKSGQGQSFTRQSFGGYAEESGASEGSGRGYKKRQRSVVELL